MYSKTLTLLILILFSTQLKVKGQETEYAVVEGIILNNVGDFTASAPINTRASFPSAFRSVFIFKGIHKQIFLDELPFKVIKTDRKGHFKVKLEPTIYTFCIQINGRFIAGNKRRDGYYDFVDCYTTNKHQIKIVDKSQARYQ